MNSELELNNYNYGSTSSKDQDCQELNLESKRGIIYLSRIPPQMNPLKIRRAFSRYGGIDRVFLQPGDFASGRVENRTASKRKQYCEGWVEFKDKKIAKAVAFSLNNTAIGLRKKSFYYNDLWNIKYLKKFKWSHLNEKLAYNNSVRQQRLRTEFAAAKKQNNIFLDNMDKSKAITAMEMRKKHRINETNDLEIRHRKLIKQKKITPQDMSMTGLSDDIKVDETLLHKIFS